MATASNTPLGYEKALAIAFSTFFGPLLFTPEDHVTRFGVEFKAGDKISKLYLPEQTPALVTYLLEHNVDSEEAWLFALRHEAAHVEINMKCFDQKLSPPNSNDQLATLKIKLSTFDKIAIPQHHKESATEAFCDITAIQYLRDNFPATWLSTATHIADFRKLKYDPKNAASSADYFTHPVIFRFIKNPQSITPTIAAEQTYKESKAQAKITDNAKSAMTEHIDDVFAAIKENRKALETKLKTSRSVKLFPQAKNNKPKDF